MTRSNIPRNDSTPSEICRVFGLTSDEGKKKNGTIGHVNISKPFGSGSDVRHPVCLDGFKGPMSIKATNLELFLECDVINNSIMIALGRRSFFDTAYVASIVRNTIRLGQTPVTSSYTARSDGNLNAVDMVLKNKWHQGQIGTYHIQNV